VIAIIALLLATAVPSLLKSRSSGNETSAIATLRGVVSTQEQYRTRFGAYTDNLNRLIEASLLPGITLDNGAITKSGYSFTQSAAGTNEWGAQASPLVAGTTGDRYFYADQTGVIRWSASGAATSSSPPLEDQSSSGSGSGSGSGAGAGGGGGGGNGKGKGSGKKA